MTANSQSAPQGTTTSPELTAEELGLATRNHGMPLEALRYDVTPIGLHYLLTHYDIPALDPAAWRLRVGGAVGHELELTLDELRSRPAVTRRVTMECAGNGRARLTPRTLSQPWVHEAVGTGEWTGTPVAPLLEETEPDDAAVEAVFRGADRGIEGGLEQTYARGLGLDELRRCGAILAYALNGAPLPPQHGAPVRLLVPGWYGMTSVKWLTSCELVDSPFDGYQQVRAYRQRQGPDEPGEPVSRMAVRSLMVPPGVPEFYTRHRIVDRGPQQLFGRAWSGHDAIVAVEVSTDGGGTWEPARIEPDQVDDASWTAWRFHWDAQEPGETELCSRATDAAGNVQPDRPGWNLGGYAVNAVQRIPVTVR